jgi:hypothetical protein
MYKLDFRKYLGQAGEDVSITAVPSGGGRTLFTLDGVDQGVCKALTFNLADEPGTQHVVRVDLVGADGEICAVGVQNVDDAEDITKIAIIAPFPTRRAEWEFTVGADHALALTTQLAHGMPLSDAARRRKAPRKPQKEMPRAKATVHPFVVHRGAPRTEPGDDPGPWADAGAMPRPSAGRAQGRSRRRSPGGPEKMLP